MFEIIWGSTQQYPVASRQLADHFKGIDGNGFLYLGYPVIGTPDGPFPIDAMLVSPIYGVILFDLIEGKSADDYIERQDEALLKLQSKLIQYKKLTHRRKLTVPISTISFAPAIPSSDSDIDSVDNPIVKTLDELTHVLESLVVEFENDLYKNTLSVVQSISNIRRKTKRRKLKDSESRGGKAKRLEDSIANLDAMQSAAVIETYDGVQRIRGLAGSGKTIVLALKVAYLHAQNPDWKIAVTFNTRSLKGYLEKLITGFTLEQTNEDPDWDNVRIISAWGAPGGESRNGLYYEFCSNHGIEYFDFRAAKNRFGSDNAFEGVCEIALNEAKEIRPRYDAILIDEAQDFAPSFLRLCYEFTKDPHRIVYAYDELQSLNDRSMPPPEEIFGTKKSGEPRVTFNEASIEKHPRQDIILEKCYRNSRPVLTTAHSFGFGIYRESLVQMFGHKELWTDIGYRVHDGDLKDGHRVLLSRTPETSPAFLEEHSKIDDIISLHKFNSIEDQNDWLVNSIIENLEHDELEYDDIIVINTDPITTRDAVSSPRKILFDNGINSNLAGVSTSPDIFYTADSITFTGIYRAKGNEAPMVYIINSEYCSMGSRLEYKRNILFTAITRSKAWVRVCGVGPKMDTLINEFTKLKEANFQLDFVYPTKEERKQMRMINRDIDLSTKKELKRTEKELREMVKSIQDGKTFIEDYSPELIRKLKEILS